MTVPQNRIGILTAGGDCPGLNAVIRGVVKSSQQLGYDCIGFLKGYEGLVDPVRYMPLNARNTSGILNQGGTILGSTNKGRFAATVGVQDRLDLAPDLLDAVEVTLRQLNICGLICVGGDGTLAVAQQFHERGLPVVGVPKTIDNDLSATAFTFGFDSAVACATDALDRLHTTGASHERIMVLEVMGRHAGWIALHAGIAGGGDVILIPEIDWTYENVCHKILAREAQGKKFTLVVVAEAVRIEAGEAVVQNWSPRAVGGAHYGGIGHYIGRRIAEATGAETRVTVLGHLQRGGMPNPRDRLIASAFGVHAVDLIAEGRFDRMVAWHARDVIDVPLEDAMNSYQAVDPEGALVRTARGLGISFGDG